MGRGGLKISRIGNEPAGVPKGQGERNLVRALGWTKKEKGGSQKGEL